MKILVLYIVIVLFLISVHWGETNESKGVQNFKELIQRSKCSMCKKTIDLFRSVLISDLSVNIFAFLGQMYWNIHYSNAQCFAMIDAYKDMIKEGLRRKTFDSDYFCEITISFCENTHYKKLEFEDYAEKLLSDKPEIIKNNDYIDKLYKEITKDEAAGIDREKLVLFHLSDLHWDLGYKVGASDRCGSLICWEDSSGKPFFPSYAAGKWGDYKCDANPKLIEQIRYTIEEIGQPAFIIWTGDNIQHAIEKSPNVTTNNTVQITEFIKKYAPGSLIFTIHGNHEFNPMNTQDMSLELDPVIDILSKTWRQWLTDDVYNEYRKNTYFQYKADTHPLANHKFRNQMDKTRIISLNTQNCYFFNFYLLKEDNDPKKELEWLETTLRKMEKAGEVAIIIGHMSPGVPDCLNEVSSRLRVIFDRFQHVIRLNLFGHTHFEEFEVIRAIEDNKPVGVNFLAPSFTTYQDTNPSFRVITLDVKTKLPVKIDTYTLDILKANQDDENAKFLFNHEMAEEYGLQDLGPSSFLNLSQQFATNKGLADKYEINMLSKSPSGYRVSEDCGPLCRRKLSCNTGYSTYQESLNCYGEWYYKYFDFSGYFYLDSKVLASWLFKFMYGVWVEKV